MRTARALLASASLASATAFAHPGHDAPPVHAHDLDELLMMGAVILLAAVIGLAIRAVRRAKNRDR